MRYLLLALALGGCSGGSFLPVTTASNSALRVHKSVIPSGYNWDILGKKKSSDTPGGPILK
jgi:hypothetical protein